MKLSVAGRAITLLSASDTAAVAYVIGGFDGAEEIARRWPRPRASLALIDCPDWNAALSPWPAPACFRGGENFSGGAEAFLRELTGEIIPACEEALGLEGPERAIIGVSLGGLFALYALFRTEMFDRAGSVSGSLWFDGFMEFARENAMPRPPRRLYLSLGDREEHTRNERLRQVGEATREAQALFSQRGIDTILEMNPGNHFVDGAERLVKALSWLYREKEEET